MSDASGITRVVAQLDEHQIAVYLLGLAAGAVVGLSASGTAPALEHAIEPVLAALLYATFLQVPFTALSQAGVPQLMGT